MRSVKRIIIPFMLCSALLLSGCAVSITGKARVQKEAFGEKTYALVTIAASKELAGEKGLAQMFKDSSEINGKDTQPIIDKLMPPIRAAFARTGYFRSMPMKTIVNSKAYKALAEDERVQKVAFFTNELNVAKGYKYFSEPQKLAQLARELGVDGVICVYLNFSVQTMKSGMYVAMLSVGKKEYAASAAISVVAYDTEGNILWKDSTLKRAEPGDKKAIIALDFSDITATHFEKLHPSAVLIGEHAVQVLVQRFTDTMEGKVTSRFQRVSDKGTKLATQ